VDHIAASGQAQAIIGAVEGRIGENEDPSGEGQSRVSQTVRLVGSVGNEAGFGSAFKVDPVAADSHPQASNATGWGLVPRFTAKEHQVGGAIEKHGRFVDISRNKVVRARTQEWLWSLLPSEREPVRSLFLVLLRCHFGPLV